MNLMHERVEHKTFGVGEIIHQEGNIIQVRFRESSSIKKFLFPDSFETFLSVCNADLIPEVEEALHITQLQKIEARRIETERQEAIGVELRKARQAKMDSRKRSSKKLN